MTTFFIIIGIIYIFGLITGSSGSSGSSGRSGSNGSSSSSPYKSTLNKNINRPKTDSNLAHKESKPVTPTIDSTVSKEIEKDPTGFLRWADGLSEKNNTKETVSAQEKNEVYGIRKIIQEQNKKTSQDQDNLQDTIESIFNSKVERIKPKSNPTHKIKTDKTSVPPGILNNTANKIEIWKRKVKYIVHFTRVENLPNILREGITPRTQLENSNSSFIYNDNLRLDGIKNSISLSISFPNYRMLYRLRKENPDADWAILLINPHSIFADFNNPPLFFKTNAASSKNKTQGQQSTNTLMSDLFYDQELRDKLQLPENFPTDPQAEILYTTTLDPASIELIHFETVDRQKDIKYIQNITQDNPDKKFLFSNEFFAPRADYAHWKSQLN